MIPLSLPGLITVTIFNVTGWWNDLLVPLIFLQSNRPDDGHGRHGDHRRSASTDYPLLLAGLFTASCRRCWPTSCCSGSFGRGS